MLKDGGIASLTDESAGVGGGGEGRMGERGEGGGGEIKHLGFHTANLAARSSSAPFSHSSWKHAN